MNKNLRWKVIVIITTFLFIFFGWWMFSSIRARFSIRSIDTQDALTADKNIPST